MAADLTLLAVALAASVAASVLRAWHGHAGGPWLFAAGGFLHVFGRLCVVIVCADVAARCVAAFSASDGDATAMALLAVPAAIASALGLWALFVLGRLVYADAYGPDKEQEAHPTGNAGTP